MAADWFGELPVCVDDVVPAAFVVAVGVVTTGGSGFFTTGRASRWFQGLALPAFAIATGSTTTCGLGLPDTLYGDPLVVL